MFLELLGNWIHIHASQRNGEILYVIGFEDRTESGGEFRVVVAYNVRRLILRWFFGKCHAPIASKLCHPDSVKIGRHVGNVSVHFNFFHKHP
jgi:hypothetical protein